MSRIALAGLSVAAVMALAGSAQATFFSFASDNLSNSFTFKGTAGSNGQFTITEDVRPNSLQLLVDDNNGALPTLSVASEFRASLTASTSGLPNGGLVILGPGSGGQRVEFNYLVNGTFGFYRPTGGANAGAAMLTATVTNGILKVPGILPTTGAARWSTTGAVLGFDAPEINTDVTYTATSEFVAALGGTATANNYGIFVGPSGSASSINPDDFGFTLTALNAGTLGVSVNVDRQTNLPTTAWKSESSFSGSAANGVPTPGAAALLAFGGAFVARRRRA